MKVLVTGANGFVGSWLCRALVSAGHEVHAVVRKSADLSELKGIPVQFHEGDVTQIETLVEALSGVDTVFHLAGVVAYRRSDRGLMEKVNVEGTRNIVQAVSQTGVRRLVHMSSVVAVGAGFKKDEVLNEESTFNLSKLELGYFETKLRAEEVVRSGIRDLGIDAVMVNPSTVYGPGDAKKGSRKTQVKVAQGRFPFYTTGGVSVVAIEDVIEGILAAWERGRRGERYILSGENITIKELFEIIADEAGVSPPQRCLPRFVLFALGRIGDILTAMGLKSSLSLENAWSASLYHWFDHSKATKELGFQPRSARFAIGASVAWMKNNGMLDRK